MKDTPFTAYCLLALYDQVAESEDAIPRLRRFVLDLAVRGKLVEQDPTDEPAAELFKQIAIERNARVKGGEIRKSKPNDPIDVEPWDTPSRWVWLPLGDTGHIFTGNSIDAGTRERLEKTTAGRPFIATKDVGYGLDPIAYENGLFVSASDESFKVARAHSVLICAEGGSAGRKIGLTDREICFGNKLLANETWSVVSPRYVLFVYQSRAFYEQFVGQMTGVIGGISINKFLQLPFPLPPLAEQRRIVGRVDELMALCDQLEQARVGREAVRAQLTAATLARLTAPETDAEAFPSHARFALQTLPSLTTRPDQIKTLRQAILNLAVRGKLVEQDPTDEPAVELLKRIAKEVAFKRKSMSLRPQDALPMVDESDTPFELPVGWAWARFPEVGVFARGKSKHRPRNDPALYVDGTIPFVQTGDVARSMGLITTHSSVYNETGLQQSMLWPAGTMCITIAANIADSGILTFDACFPDSVVGLVAASCFENGRFFEYFVRTAKANLTEFAPATAQKNINLGILEMVLIPLPPLAEQHRIVAKVDALMAICDQLEASLSTTTNTRSRLLEALLHEALGSTLATDAA